MAFTKNLFGSMLLLVLCSVGALGQGWVQSTSATTSSAANISATLTLTAGNMVIADVWDGYQSNGIQPTISDNYGDIFYAAPPTQSGDPTGTNQSFYCPYAHGGATTITVTTTGGNTSYDLVLTEVSGMAVYSPLFNSTTIIWQSGTTSGEVAPMTLPAGTYYIHVPVGDLTTGSTYSGTSGYTQRANTGTFIHALFDQTVTVSTPTSYPLTVVASAEYGNYVFGPYLVFSTTSTTTPRRVQFVGSGSLGGAGGTTAFMPVPVTLGNYLLAYAAFNGANPSSISDTMGNTWIRYGQILSSDSFGIWVAKVKTTGYDTITAAGGDAPSMEVLEIGGSGGLDVYSASDTSGTSVSSGNITTTVAGDLVEVFGNTGSACNTNGFTNTYPAGFVSLAGAASHCTDQQGYEGLAPTIGTYSTTTTATSGTGAIAAAVIAFKPAPAPPPSSNPVTNVITELVPATDIHLVAGFPATTSLLRGSELWTR